MDRRKMTKIMDLVCKNVINSFNMLANFIKAPEKVLVSITTMTKTKFMLDTFLLTNVAMARNFMKTIVFMKDFLC